MNLTKAQERAVKYSGRNLQLIACAGSGKTEVVARRVAHLLTKRGRNRLEPRNIVAFTFTNKAAAELKERIVQRTNDVTGLADMYVGTIHGFCLELLQNEVPKYLKYEVLKPVQRVLYVNYKSMETGLTGLRKFSGGHLQPGIDTNLYLSTLNVLREDTINKW